MAIEQQCNDVGDDDHHRHHTDDSAKYNSILDGSIFFEGVLCNAAILMLSGFFLYFRRNSQFSFDKIFYN